MRTKTMEGLIGAGVNMDLMNVPIKVYKEARLKNDVGTMQRAMGYAGDFAKEAKRYKTAAEEGTKEDAKDAKEKEKESLKETIEKHRKEREEMQNKMQAKIEEKRDAKKEGGQEAAPNTEVKIASEAASLEVSEAGRRLAENFLQAGD